MKNKIDIKSLVFGALLGAVVLFSIGAATGTGQWDYKIVYGPGGLEQQVRKVAGDGWEVVSSGGGDASPFVILRKSK